MNSKHLPKLASILIIQIAGVLYYLWFLSRHGYLPSPFFYHKDEVLLDYFNPLYWSDRSGAYTIWQSFYPPLNFLFLKLVKLFLLGNASYSNPLDLRSAAPSAALFFLFSYLIIPVFIIRSRLWDSFASSEKLMIYFIAVLSTPMLFTLERGNLIIFSLIFISPMMSKSGLVRAICIATLINIKPYFVLLLLFYLIRKSWKDFGLCSLIAGLIFIGSCLLSSTNYPLLIFSNIFNFAQVSGTISLKEVMAMPSSISAYATVLDHLNAQPNKYSVLLNLHALATTISAVKWLAIIGITIATLRSHRRLSDAQLFTALLIVVTNLGTWVGGWTLIFYVTLVPVLVAMQYGRFYGLILLLLFLPLDWAPLVKETLGEQYSYLADSMVDVDWAVGLGSALKPILNFSMLTVFTYEISQLGISRESKNTVK